MFGRRSLLLVILGCGACLSLQISFDAREEARRARAISIAKSARFGPARIRLEQTLKKIHPQAAMRWSATEISLLGEIVEVELAVDQTGFYGFSVHLQTKEVTGRDEGAQSLIDRCRAVPLPGT